MNRTIVQTVIKNNLFRDKVTIFPTSFMLLVCLKLRKTKQGIICNIVNETQLSNMFHRRRHMSFYWLR